MAEAPARAQRDVRAAAGPARGSPCARVLFARAHTHTCTHSRTHALTHTPRAAPSVRCRLLRAGAMTRGRDATGNSSCRFREHGSAGGRCRTCCECCGWMCLRAQAGWLLRPPTASMPACRPSQRPRAGTSLNRKSPRPRGPSGASAQTSSSSDQCRGQAVLPTTSSAVALFLDSLPAWAPRVGAQLAVRLQITDVDHLCLRRESARRVESPTRGACSCR